MMYLVSIGIVYTFTRVFVNKIDLKYKNIICLFIAIILTTFLSIIQFLIDFIIGIFC
jgi:hypothetical protein